MANKEVDAMVRSLRRQGFTVEYTKKGHRKIKKAGRVVAMLPGTPGGGSRALKQIIKRELPKLEAEGYVHDGLSF